ncbi:MAG: hypothetical protein AABZ31_09580 [Bdellovibrionota bacterium]
MTACPNCQTENDADFGLVSCVSCGRAFFIEIDGSARAADAAPVAESSAPKAGTFASQVSDQLSNILMEDLSAPVNFSANDSSGESVSGESSDDFSNNDENNFFGLSSSDEPVVVPQAIVAAARTEVRKENPDMREVAAFGNSDASLAREGGYRFNLSIYGIDSSDIRQEVKDALTDARFLWDLESLLGKIDQGVLQLNDLSAVKSALIVQRLKTLPVDIKWEQYAIHQA